MQQTAVLGMGCFWCGESAFRDYATQQLLPGVLDIQVGYAGGTQPNPTYENHFGYKEAVKVVFDPQLIAYEKILDLFWNNIDPFDPYGQFYDQGFSYTTVIYYNSEEQKYIAEDSLASRQQQFTHKIATQITPFTNFYRAEEYHQNYACKNPANYDNYKQSSGREQRLSEIWDQDN